MRALIQRVSNCSVKVEDEIVGSIGKGMLIFLGIKKSDSGTDATYLAKRCTSIRIFDDSVNKMNLSIKDINGEILVVSQFTLYGDTNRGNRPSYSDAATSDVAESLYNHFVDEVKKIIGENRIRTGKFRAMMKVELINDGPVTLLIESKNN